MGKKPFEVLIIGGGIAGPVLALALQKIGCKATVFEAQPEIAKSKGSWLALMPNGVNALKVLGLASLEGQGWPCKGLDFCNHRNKNLGRLDHDSFKEKFGSSALVMKRSTLHEYLHQELARAQIQVFFNKRLKAIEQKRNAGVVAHFEDGTCYEADMLAGCDGIHSKTRSYVVKEAIKPNYTGVIGFGGFSGLALGDPDPHQSNDLVMTFGKEAFFGYFPTSKQETFWYSNIPQLFEPNRSVAPEQAQIQSYLASVHRTDPNPIRDLIQHTTFIDQWVIYDLPPLPHWYGESVVLVGDAAHATSPHGAQGASLAIEDALMLAKCIRDLPDKESIFKAYQQFRKARVERQAKQARNRGNQNLNKNPISVIARDFFMPIALKAGWVKEDWLYRYEVNWQDKNIESK